MSTVILKWGKLLIIIIIYTYIQFGKQEVKLSLFSLYIEYPVIYKMVLEIVNDISKVVG